MQIGGGAQEEAFVTIRQEGGFGSRYVRDIDLWLDLAR